MQNKIMYFEKHILLFHKIFFNSDLQLYSIIHSKYFITFVYL